MVMVMNAAGTNTKCILINVIHIFSNYNNVNGGYIVFFTPQGR